MLKFPSNGYGYGQPHSTTNYHRTYSGEQVTMVAERPPHPGGAVQVQQHQVVHKSSSFKEVDGAKAPANPRCFDNYPMKANNAALAAGSFHHRYDSYEKTTNKKMTCEEDTYAYSGGRRVEYSHKQTYVEEEDEEEEEEEEEEEFVVGGGGCAQLIRRGYRGG